MAEHKKDNYEPSSDNDAINYIRLVWSGAYSDDAYNVKVLCTLIQGHLEPCKDYNADLYTAFSSRGVSYQAFATPDQSMGCLIITSGEKTCGVSIADFKKETQTLIQVADDKVSGISTGPLRNGRLLGIKNHFPLNQ